MTEPRRTLNFPGFPPIPAIGPDITEIRGLPVPRGYTGVEHADGTVHAIDLDNLHDETPDWPDGMPLWREPVVCGRATGVSSDEGGRSALHRRILTCLDCIAILG